MENVIYHKTFKISDQHDWVVLVHGAGGSSSIWYKQLKDYTKEFNVLLVDLRGHGKSKDFFKAYMKAKYSFEDVSRDVIDVLDLLKIEKAHFVGISLGTILIRAITELAPERVQSMVLGGAIVRLNLRSKFLMWIAKMIQRLVPFLWVYKLYAFILMPRKRHQESRNLFVQEAKRLANKEFLRWFKLHGEVNPLLNYFSEKEVKVPTLYLMGDEDYMFLSQVQHLVKRHRHAILKIFDSCGHVVNVEKPDDFNRVSMEFMHDPYLAV